MQAEKAVPHAFPAFILTEMLALCTAWSWTPEGFAIDEWKELWTHTALALNPISAFLLL